MASGALRSEEQVGLVLAVALHAALIGVLLWRPAIAPPPVPQRISVTLSPDVGLQATAPTHADATADMAPKLGTPPPVAASVETPAPVVPPPPARIAAPPVEKPAPEPRPVAVTRPRPAAVKPIEPAPVSPPPAKVTPPRRHAAKPQDTSPVPAAPAARAAAKHAPSVKDWSLDMPASPDRQTPGASRIGNDFLKGVSGGKAGGKAQQQGAAVIGPEVKSALSGAIAHQLKPHWVAPQGADADQLVTILSWDLNRDGSLAGLPRVVRQEGITDSNRPQAARHAEQAIRAVQLGAPFQLPPEYYDTWKHIRSFEFNRTLSQ